MQAQAYHGGNEADSLSSPLLLPGKRPHLFLAGEDRDGQRLLLHCCCHGVNPRAFVGCNLYVVTVDLSIG